MKCMYKFSDGEGCLYYKYGHLNPSIEYKKKCNGNENYSIKFIIGECTEKGANY